MKVHKRWAVVVLKLTNPLFRTLCVSTITKEQLQKL